MNDSSAPSGRTPRRFLAIRRPVGPIQTALSAIAIWIVFFGLWSTASALGWVTELLMPSPTQVITTLYEMIAERGFLSDIGISVLRVAISFGAACAIAVPLGLMMGAFPSVEAIVNPFTSAWRYLPAPAFIPVLLMWFGTGEAPKLALLFIGVVFFLITLVMDHTKQVRMELIETGMTLGAGRWTILRSVIAPAVAPNILVAMRQMLAISWTYLVIAEIIASTTGIGAMMMRARRFLHTDEIMAGIIVIGALGLGFDLLFRKLRDVLFPYLVEGKE